VRIARRNREVSLNLPRESTRSVDGSILVIVLWVALGLVSITLYFASSMSLELQAADNRVAGLGADQAIEGGIRYVQYVLSTLGTNGVVPDLSSYQSQAVPIGDSHIWLIGRAGDYQAEAQPEQVFFGLIDESSKIDLNTVSLERLSLLTNMTSEMAANIVDWRNTNGTTSANGDGPSVYSQFQPAYLCKNGPYETLDELRLVYPMDMGTLVGEDFNRNGALDPSETDTNRNGWADCGLLEYFTVYAREPNTRPDGSSRVSVSRVTPTSTELRTLLQTNLSGSRLTEVMTAVGLVAAGGGGQRPGQGGGGPPQAVGQSFASTLQFFLRSGMTADEFAPIANSLTTSTAATVYGRVNVNTASPAVLTSLPGITSDVVQQLVTYRRSYPDKLTSMAWLVDALGRTSSALTQLAAAGDLITTRSYQFTADIAALGPYGRGYRRVKCIFDTSTGSPVLIYRQDLSSLGWALGKYVRQAWLIAKDTR
jgi:DNA uptake protein ComE-like DNA-binding protein